MEKMGRPRGNVGESGRGECVELIRKYGDGDGEEGKGKGYVLMIGWERLEDHEAFMETVIFRDAVEEFEGKYGGVEMVSSLFFSSFIFVLEWKGKQMGERLTDGGGDK